MTTARCAAGLLALVTLGLAGCGETAPKARPGAPNLVLISIDTLRADHLGSYGYERETSPHLDAFAATALRYAEARAPTPWTLPSHAGLLSGIHPYRLGLVSKDGALPLDAPLLAELLSGAGYETGAFVDSSTGGYLGAKRGFDRGFAHFSHAPHGRITDRKYDVAVTVDVALDWLDRQEGDRPFFLFLHTKSVHAAPTSTPCFDHRCMPYDAPAPHRFRYVPDEEAPQTWSSPERGSGQAYLWSLNAELLDGSLQPADIPAADLEVLEALYDGGISYTDEYLGHFLEELSAWGLDRDTAILITSDHGEAFLDHNLFQHQEVYEPLLRIPLLLRLPGQTEGAVIDTPVALEDAAATLLDLAGVERPAKLTARPLPLPDEPAEERRHFAYYLFPPKFDYRAFAITEGPWKLVRHNPYGAEGWVTELYDLTNDPLERTPLDDPARRRLLDERLDALLAQRPVAQRTTVDESAEEARALSTLGYID